MAYLEWQGISKSYGSARVLDGVNLSMEREEILAVLGPSGSGKTTLLRITCGLDQPDSGAVLLDERDLSGVPTHRRSMGLMFQDYGLFPHLNVEGNVAFGLRMKRWPGERRRARVREMLDLVRLAAARTRPVSTLSGGEKQRIALARSLAPSPSLLMLDEPFGALDAVLRSELLGELPAILRRAGATVLYVTHDREEAIGLADRIALIRAGKIVQVGTPEQLIAAPSCAFTASFLGLGAVVPAALQGGRIETDVGRFEAQDPARADRTVRDAFLLIRPAALSIPPEAPAAVVSAVILSRTPGADGSTLRLGLRGAKGLYEISMRMGSERRLPEAGATIQVGIDVKQTMMLDA